MEGLSAAALLALRLQRAWRQYFVEYVRQQLDARFGPDLYTAGLRIYTTLDLDMQQAAERALEAPARGHRERRRTGSIPGRPTASTSTSGATTTPDDGTASRPVPPGPRGDARGQDRRHPRHGRRPRLRGQQVQPRDPGARASPARPSSRSCTPRRSGPGIRCRTIMVDDPISVAAGARPAALGARRTTTRSSTGPMTLRQALYESRNIIAIKLGMEVGARTR